ncbi:MAG TPA: hypothetical protein VMT85_11005 [Thermoanaerobaculia bacterium]|nr:hypothetical protein [Thermoanaerobaculia bacterium]
MTITISDHHSAGRARPGAVATRAATVAVLLGFCALGAAAGAADTDGFLYGRVTTGTDSEYTGLLRWGTEEAFWDDLFNSGKVRLPFFEDFGTESRRVRTISILGKEFKVQWGESASSRHFVVRFGDIDRIEVLGAEEANIHLRGGEVAHVKGLSNDVSATIEVKDATLGDVKVPWRKIREIQFMATPSNVKPDAFRLSGRVETTQGTFDGFIQWDKQECLSTDKLDGEDDGIVVALDMGQIRSIERKGGSASVVVLRDGRSMTLTGTNDVNDRNRGILVEDQRFGRVEIPWRAFRRVEFREADSSGPGYESYRSGGPLRGTARDRSGRSYSGRIVFDLDEAYGWEMLDGNDDEIVYSIPFGLVAKVEPLGSESARVTLRTGETLTLEGTQDVSDSNDGILVFEGGSTDEATHIEWDDLEFLELSDR